MTDSRRKTAAKEARIKTKGRPTAPAPSRPGDMGARETSRISTAWAVSISLALIVLLVATYAPIWQHDFVDYDDPDYVRDNPKVNTGLSAANVSWAFTSGHAANWHPLTWVSHMLDAQIFGVKPGAFHAVSLTLHILSALLLFGFLYRTTGASVESGIVAALFAAHPLHVESVAWIAERKDVLAGFFWMLTLWAYAAYVKQPRWTRYVLVMAAFAAGLMAKPVLVTLPFALLLLDIWPLRRVDISSLSRARGLVTEKLPLFALAAASSVITFLVQQQGGAVQRVDQVSPGLRVANAAVSYAAYIRDTFWPAGLAAFYPLSHSLSPIWVAASCLLLAGVTVMGMRLARSHPYFIVGWLWYLGTLIPMIGLVQVGNQARADRYTYLPLIGVFIVIAWGLTDLGKRWKIPSHVPSIIAVIAILACAGAAHAQVAHWKNSQALWTRALAVTTGNYAANNALGLIRAKEGKLAEATALYQESLKAKPDFVETRNNFGVTLANQGKRDEAIIQFNEAIRLAPQYPEAHSNLAGALAMDGKMDEAIKHLYEAVRLKPDYSGARNNLGFALLSQGKADEAVVQFTESIKSDPGFPNAHYGMAMALERQGKIAAAIQESTEALRLRPDYPEAQQKLEELKRRGQ